jgi:hypothetical protein
MNKRPVRKHFPFWFLAPLALVGGAAASASNGPVAAYEAQGFVVVATTQIDATDTNFLFEGCETDIEVFLDNGQVFRCGETLLIVPEWMPDAIVLQHPTSGEARLVVEEHGFVGTLEGIPVPAEGTANPAPVPAGDPTPIPAPAPLPVAAPAPATMPTSPVPATAATPGPLPLPPAFVSPATPPTTTTQTPLPPQVTLLAPVEGTWAANAVMGGVRVEALALLNPDGTFNRFERWDFGLTVQIWGTYRVTPMTADRFQLSQQPTGWDPREWCVVGDVCEPLKYPASATQFTFLDANRVRDDETQVVYTRQPQ